MDKMFLNFINKYAIKYEIQKKPTPPGIVYLRFDSNVLEAE